METATIGWLFLAASAVGAAFTASALLRLRRLCLLHLPLLHGRLADQRAGAPPSRLAGASRPLAFVAAGALESVPGRAGLALTLRLVDRPRRRLAPRAPGGRGGARGAPRGPRRVELRALPPRPRAEPVPLPTPGRRAHSRRRLRRSAPGRPGPPQPARRVPPRAQPAPGAPVLLPGARRRLGDRRQGAAGPAAHEPPRGARLALLRAELPPRAARAVPGADRRREALPRLGARPRRALRRRSGLRLHHRAARRAATSPRSRRSAPATARSSPASRRPTPRSPACVPFYGVYDFLDRDGLRGSQAMAPFLERFVLRCPPGEARARWEAASPLYRVHADAPPFLVIHGTHDSLAWVEEARRLRRGAARRLARPGRLPGAARGAARLRHLPLGALRPRDRRRGDLPRAPARGARAGRGARRAPRSRGRLAFSARRGARPRPRQSARGPPGRPPGSRRS